MRRQKGEFTLFLDSLDECLVHIHPVSQLLLRELRNLPVSHLRLRVTCRTAEWPELLSCGLRELWPDRYEELELAPLRRRDVRVAAQLCGLDGGAFLQEAQVLEMAPFASRPITLSLLLRQSRESGRLPATVTALYEKGCRALAAEWSPSRHASRAAGHLTADDPVVEPEGVVGRAVGGLFLFGSERGGGRSLAAWPAGRVEQRVDPPLAGEPLGLVGCVARRVGQARLW